MQFLLYRDNLEATNSSASHNLSEVMKNYDTSREAPEIPSAFEQKRTIIRVLKALNNLSDIYK